MITDHDIARLCADIYLAPVPAGWDELQLPDEGIAFGLKDLGRRWR